MSKLNGSDIIKEIMKATGTRQTDLAGKVGLTQGALSGKINRPRLSLDAFATIMSAMGCEVVVRFKCGEPDGEWIVSPQSDCVTD